VVLGPDGTAAADPDRAVVNAARVGPFRNGSVPL